jgi:hypothetical protein
LWRIGFLPAVLLFFSIFCFVGLPACSTTKGAQKPKQAASGPESSLISKDAEEVMAKLGVPTVVSKTNDGRVLWVYRPTLKILPNDNGTLYVEFDEGKVIKIFKKQ